MIARSASDAALLARANDGSPEAFGVLATRYRNALTRLAFRYLGDAEEAHDVAQEALLRAYQHLASHDRERPFRSWLFTIARNLALNARRSRKRARSFVSFDDSLASRDEGPEQCAVREEAARAMRDALAALPALYRTPLELRYFSGLSYTEIALTLGVPLGTLKARLNRGKRFLRGTIESGWSDVPPLAASCA